MGLEHLTDEELEEIEGKNEGRAKAVLETRKASEDAKQKLRVIDGDARLGVASKSLDDPPGQNSFTKS